MKAVEWMEAARRTIYERCSDEAYNDGAEPDSEIWQNIYDNCVTRTVNELLLSDERPAGTACHDIKPSWCNGEKPDPYP